MAVVPIETLDDLKKILLIQKQVSSKAENELMMAAEQVEWGKGQDPVVLANHYFTVERKVLEKYVIKPSLSEMSGRLSESWGATFAVATLVGELLLNQLKDIHPDFTKYIYPLFMVYLNEMNNPDCEYLVDPMMEHLIGSPLLSEVSSESKLESVSNLAEDITTLCISFGILVEVEEGVEITAMGLRMYKHLIDAVLFVKDMSEAHQRFQLKKPNFSMKA